MSGAQFLFAIRAKMGNKVHVLKLVVGLNGFGVFDGGIQVQLDNFTFGITMLVAGMGGTLLTLWIMSLLMTLLGKIFPVKEEEEGKKEA
jgi:hypothetical protein